MEEETKKEVEFKGFSIETTKPQFKALEFKGSAKEYFKIWIVNVALTLLTLGVYSAWAKVRTNRYIYRNTYLFNSNFEYNANPKKILFGRVVIVLFYALFILFSDFLGMVWVSALLLLLFIILLPWFIRQAISFRLKNTSYRNIPFYFAAKSIRFYILAFKTLFMLILIPTALLFLASLFSYMHTLIATILFFLFFLILAPWLYLEYKSLIINSIYYGTTPFRFHATKKDTIKLFFQILIWTLLITLILTTISGTISLVGSNYFKIEDIKEFANSKSGAMWLTLFGTVIYLFNIGLYKGVIDAALSNFTRNHTTIKDGVFRGEIKPLKLAWISASNAILLLFSLGLLYPYTKLRYLKYKIENSSFACSNLEHFYSNGYQESSPIGEEALDFFDIDIGF